MRENKILRNFLYIFGTGLVSLVLVFFGFFASVKNSDEILETDAASSVHYASADDYLSILSAVTNDYESYSLLDYYPIYTENQTTTDLCWVYSSSKALESAFLVQSGELYNFSESATVIVNYLKNYTSSEVSTNAAGNFYNFVQIAELYGLVHESDFSNDITINLSDSVATDYSYVLDLVDETIMDNVEPICFGDSSTYTSYASNTKIQLMKNFVLEYGGLFAGIEEGSICYDDKLYYPLQQSYGTYDAYVSGNHAVCIIGWDDTVSYTVSGTSYTGAFIAINSWGVGAYEYSTFYIPYSYTDVLNTLCGFIVGDETGIDVVLSSSSADEYSKTVLGLSSNYTDNIFLAGESISLIYTIPSSLYANSSVAIYSGGSDDSSLFTIHFDDENNTVSISSNSEFLSKYSGCYLIKFYASEELIDIREFYVYTGAEISYAQLYKLNSNSQTTSDSVQMKNNFVTQENSSTFYVSSDNLSSVNFILRVYLLSTESSKSYSGSDVTTMTISSVYVTNSETGSSNAITNNVTIQKYAIESGTKGLGFQLQIYGLTDITAGSLVYFYTTVTSIYGYSSVYYFMFFVTDYSGVTTSSTYDIIYDLDGGENNPLNVTRYPSVENSISKTTTITLQTPTKNNANFLGWFLDSNFTVSIEEISSLTGSVTIYAKWESDDTVYFEAELSISGVLSYGETEYENYDSQTLTYGDGLKLLLVFTPSSSITTSYVTTLDLKIQREGEYPSEVNYSLSSGDSYYTYNFNVLQAGSYKVSATITMTINHQFSSVQTVTLEFEIEKKLVNIEFSDLEYNYSKGVSRKPSSTVTGTYDEDGEVTATLKTEDGALSKTNAGSWVFYVSSLSNSSYYVSDTVSCTMTINPLLLNLVWNEESFVYNGRSQNPSYTLNVSETVNLTLSYTYNGETVSSSDCVNAGTYSVSVALDNGNYYLDSDYKMEFTIEKKSITITFNDVTHRLSVASNNRTAITYSVSGLVGDDTKSDLNVTAFSEGLTAETAGKYAITGTISNGNYEAEIIEGTYTLLGFYYIYYSLPDGSSYTELVNEDEEPVGITRKIYSHSLFSVVNYSASLISEDGSNLFITVTITDYTWVAAIVGVVVGFLLIYYFATRKSRRMKNR